MPAVSEVRQVGILACKPFLQFCECLFRQYLPTFSTTAYYIAAAISRHSECLVARFSNFQPREFVCMQYHSRFFECVPAFHPAPTVRYP